MKKELMTVLLTLLVLAGEDNRDKVLYLYKTFHDGYIFHLKTNFTLTEEELFCIIDGIVITEDPPPL